MICNARSSPPRPRSTTPRRSSTARHSLSSAGSRRAAPMIGRQADWEKAKALRERAEAEAHYLDLVAPAAGTIIRRDGEIGQIIAADKPLLWMSCCAPLRVSAEVDEEDIAQVRPGQEVLIRADAFPGQIFHGTVQAITPKGDPVARTYRVRVSLPKDTPLMIGMTAETNIVLRKAEQRAARARRGGAAGYGVARRSTARYRQRMSRSAPRARAKSRFSPASPIATASSRPRRLGSRPGRRSGRS